MQIINGASGWMSLMAKILGGIEPCRSHIVSAYAYYHIVCICSNVILILWHEIKNFF